VPHDQTLVLRLPADLVEKLDQLLPKLAADPQLAAWGRPTRSSVARLALITGIEELEKSGKNRRKIRRP
jgi:hypothetical protein